MVHRFATCLLRPALVASALLAAFLPAPVRAEGDSPLGPARQLILSGIRSGEGYFNTDGTKMIFQSERDEGNPFFQIFLLDLDTGETKRLSKGDGRSTCAWLHPDGKRALFSATHEDPNWKAVQDEELLRRKEGRPKKHRWVYDEHYDIYQADIESGELVNLTRSLGYDAEASYSPDGRTVVFASNRRAYAGELTKEEQAQFEKDPSSVMDLYLMDADGSNVRRVTDAPGQDGGPFFSADGSRIVWRRFAVSGPHAEIWVMDSDGGNPRQLTRLGAMSWAPFFHPSGDYVIFATNIHGFANFELYLVDSEGRLPPVRVTELDGFDGLPVFTPDGAHLAWTSNRTANGQGQIFFADWDDKAARRLLGLSAEGGAAAGAVTGAGVGAQATGPEIAAADIRAHVEVLASPEMGGRRTGSEGELKATRYVADRLAALGFEPAGDNGSWYQEFTFTKGVKAGEGNRFRHEGRDGTTAGRLDEDWRPLAFSASGTFKGPLAFAGYGIVAPPHGDQPAFDAYGEMDVKGKFVLVFRYVPEAVSPERRQHLSRFASLRQKAMAARERGAAGLIVVSGPSSKVKHPLVPLQYGGQVDGSSLPAISVSDELAAILLAMPLVELGHLQKRYDGGGLPASHPRTPGTVELTVVLQHEEGRGRNVVGRLPSGAADRPPLLLGAHLDHIGDGEEMGSLARNDEKGQVHPGADDNASGVGVMLDVAEAVAAQVKAGKLKPTRDFMVAAWSGEEMGLLGSAHFAGRLGAADGPAPKGLAAYVNMDMVGRLRDQFIVYGLASSPAWGPVVERANLRPGLPLVVQQETYLPTDATSFYVKGVPILSAFTGVHELYNTPRDTPETLNYEGAERIAKFIFGACRAVLTGTEELPYQKVERKMPPPAHHGGRRVYLGTVPDFAAGGIKGVKLADTAKGGPAHAAGIRGGDVIVELAGKSIENLEEYAYAMQLLKVGEPVKVVVLRDGERIELELVPGSRD